MLSQVGSKGRRATFLGTANHKAQPFAHDEPKDWRTLGLLLPPFKLIQDWGLSFRCLSPVVTAPARPYWLP